jgi:hypothetical protein
MRKTFIAAAAIAALAAPAAVPAISSASSFHGAQTTANAPTPDYNNAVGFAVSAGQANYSAGGSSTGADRSLYAGTPGAVADLIHGVQDSPAFHGPVQDWYSGLTAPVPSTPQL